MSKHNYNKDFRRPVENETAKPVVEAEEEIMQEPEETSEVEDACQVVVEEVTESVTEEVAFGIVNDCVRLNIRRTPDINASVLYTVDCNGELMIDFKHSTEEWYNVCNKAGICGYAMKKYISVKS